MVKQKIKIVMLNTFTAIDFETAQGYRWSICQTGLVRVENGKIIDKKCWLSKPPNNYYWESFTDIHGLSAETTKNSPTFDAVWPEMKNYIENQDIVAHNGLAFDFLCLEQTLEHYHLEAPVFKKHCTYRLFGDNLASLCQQHQIELNHHDALSDALACAKLFMIHQKSL